MSLYNNKDLDKYVNGLRINLWYYLSKIRNVLSILTNPNHYTDWHVELRSIRIDKTSTAFDLVLVCGTTTITLDSIEYGGGTSDGRIQIRKNGVWLDLSLNGGAVATLSDLSSIKLNNALVVAPPAVATSTTHSLRIASGLRASYTPTSSGGLLSIGVASSAESNDKKNYIVTSPRIIKAINGVTPVDGEIIIQGSGDIKVTVK